MAYQEKINIILLLQEIELSVCAMQRKMLALQPMVAGPTVTLTAPTATTAFTAPASITISATATVTTGSISKVEFYNGTTKLGEDASSPYSYSWTNVAAGTYSITAVATDNSANKSTTAPVVVKVNPAQAAYNGTNQTIPGKIEFEHYDVGGNGSAYLDNATTNSGGAAFRTDEDVDIENCTDAGTGYNIGYATAGEWLEYTVNIATAGKYNLKLRTACNGAGRTISLSANGNPIASDIAIPNTSGWQIWQDVTVNDIQLEAGIQVLRITIGATDYVNLNYMTFEAVPVIVPSISLKAGWNIIGYPLDGNANLDQALSSIWEKVDAVKNLDSFYLKSNTSFLNSLIKLYWGEGYLIKVNAVCELIWK
ncbi:MAG: carbohydrate-binding protein [Bacteroidales bacterium]|nr:carbohydrate-binding protein [Bacteroidales bacterium]